MTILEVARQTLWQGRRGILGWLAGIAAITLLYASSYHSVSGAKAAALNHYPASLKQALNLQDLSSPAGYLNSTVFGIPLLLLTTVLAISTAARAVAGDEDSGALDLWLSYPVSRSQLVLGRLLSMVATLALLASVLFLEVTALRRPASLRVDIGDLAASCLTWLLFASCLAALALLASASLGRRSTTLAVTSALALVAYLCDSFLPLVTGLGWTRSVSPYYWFLGGNPLENGLQARHCGLLLAVTAIAALLAARRLDSRDVRV